MLCRVPPSPDAQRAALCGGDAVTRGPFRLCRKGLTAELDCWGEQDEAATSSVEVGGLASGVRGCCDCVGSGVQSLPDVDLARLGLLSDGNANSQHAVVQVTIRPEQPLFTGDHRARIRPSQRLSRSAPITSSGNSMTATTNA